jgi:hypothetical protein
LEGLSVIMNELVNQKGFTEVGDLLQLKDNEFDDLCKDLNINIGVKCRFRSALKQLQVKFILFMFKSDSCGKRNRFQHKKCIKTLKNFKR